MRALLAVTALMALSLSGCSVPGISGGKPTGFSVDEPGEDGGTYVFTASDAADNYTWDMGDHLTTLYGKKVEHAYDFASGNVTVTLTTHKGDKREDFQKTLTLGSGANAPATFFLEAERNWTVPGESIRFSGRLSSDPDDDPLRYSWNCIRTGDAVRKAAHTHSGFSNYGTPAAGTVTSLYSTTPLPQADRTESGDLCEALAGSRPSTDATVQGAFERTGIYEIYLLAADPVHPSTSGSIKVWVTEPGERSDPIYRESFTNTFQGGAGGTLDEVSDEAAPDQLFDRYQGTFSPPLAALRGFVNLTYSDASEGAASLVTMSLKRGDNVLASCAEEDGNPCSAAIDAGVVQGLVTYTVEVVLERGVQTNFTVDVVLFLDTDPGKVY